ncbi:MAG: LuxR C-terminal-related transcriptional regulator [Rudanella sp.]|nr:LuxR C-terminal-related transcriptional regulator [Rudanella sp.]
MNVSALCPHRYTLLFIGAAAEAAGLLELCLYTETNSLLAALPTKHPHFAVLTSDFLASPTLFADIRHMGPRTQIVFCLLPEALETMPTLWADIDTLDFDGFCQLNELTDCLNALQTGRFYRSALLTTPPTYARRETLPGWNTLTMAEKRVLRLMLQGLNGPAIADKLCLSIRTVDHQKASAAHKLGVPGGQGSLLGFLMHHVVIVAKLLAA